MKFLSRLTNGGPARLRWNARALRDTTLRENAMPTPTSRLAALRLGFIVPLLLAARPETVRALQGPATATFQHDP